MSREWQQKRYRQFVLPEAVYFQCIWAVRDLHRMEKRIEELERNAARREDPYDGGHGVSDQGIYYGGGIPCAENPQWELRVLKNRVAMIYQALSFVPEEYRENILSNIIDRVAMKTYPGKMWRYWKQRFLYILAKKFAMI